MVGSGRKGRVLTAFELVILMLMALAVWAAEPINDPEEDGFAVYSEELWECETGDAIPIYVRCDAGTGPPRWLPRPVRRMCVNVADDTTRIEPLNCRSRRAPDDV